MAFRLCDGLSGIRPEETDAVVIAGMGGETIAQILEAAPWVRTQKVPLVLQPMSSLPELRQRLEEDGFRILEERLAREGDTLYVVMRAEAGEAPSMTPAQLWAGRQSRDPLRGDYLRGLLKKLDRALDGLSRARDGRAEDRRRELAAIRQELLEMREEWEAWQR